MTEGKKGVSPGLEQASGDVTSLSPEPLRLRRWHYDQDRIIIRHTRDLEEGDGPRFRAAIGAYVRALSSPNEAAGWLPIDTAPRDGSKFWGRCGEDAISMFWMDEFDAFVSGYRQMVMAPGYTVDGASYKNHSPTSHRPSAWMPRPSSPNETPDEGARTLSPETAGEGSSGSRPTLTLREIEP